ncbi:MAG TPA: aromatic amino acid ammonia-lyase [Spirochaetota bacterium]|mgnify:CR=1 FL=1|jgi:histidine ammonia-lyase/phenylalanine ammonia-lyase|nr:MAG: Tyrosine 2,3-aminomutase [Spirochaetes bacterium ADurb.Bin133]HNZ25689.1 aromatic amino acid ammonia-lyase [Spirochaetota bacterium]HPY88091.1 aromatic amino acid ammonia-lyase [Spirochaetota bacterium]
MEKSLIIDGNNLKVEDVYNVVKNNISVKFPDGDDFKKQINASREYLESFIKKGYPVYGVTTGFGDSCHNQINHGNAEKLQESLVNYHGIGIGENFTEGEGKAVTLVRLNSNIKGYSGIKSDTVELMKEFINRGISPVIPLLGSVGASGDLTPLSYLAATLMGKRKVYYKGAVVNAIDAINAEGLKPVRLQAKEGLAIMNGTSVMTALAALAWVDLDKLADLSDLITAFTVQIVFGNEIPFREKVSLIKNHKGQVDSANFIYNAIKGSKRVHQYEELLRKVGAIESKSFKKHEIKIQDRYSIRCAPQINGVLRDTLAFSKEWIENELNSANDNPLIDVENSVIYNSGNFYGGHISLCCDYLRIACANASDLSDKQAELIIDGKFNNLTENLAPRLSDNSELKGLVFGFKAAQISISALRSEIQFLSNPVSIHSSPTESINQDKVSLGTISARKLREQINLLYYQFSIHLLACLQAMDLVGPKEFSPISLNFYNKVRKFTSFVSEDRPLDAEAMLLAEYLQKTSMKDMTSE